VVDIPRCEIHHPLVNRVAAELKASMRETGSTCYSDDAHAGLVRGLQVAVERNSVTAQVVVVCNADRIDGARPLVDRLRERLGDQLHSLFWNGNPEVTNRVLGPFWSHVCGPEFVREQMGGVEVFFPPGAFRQSNADLFDEVLKRAHGWVEDDRRVVELYAGCGGIGLGLVGRARQVVFNEIAPDSLRGLSRGISALPTEHRRRVTVLPGSAARVTRAIDDESVVIVDPPRKGLDPEVLEALCRLRPVRLVYLSCGTDALINESQALWTAGLELREVTAYDLFPYTEHLETLAVFERGPLAP